MTTKKQTQSRDTFKRSAWNHQPLKAVPTPHVGSWWTLAAQPEERSAFIELAKIRDAERGWSNVVPHAMSPRGEFR